MFRALWVRPQEDNCICSSVCFTWIGVSSLVSRRDSKTLPYPPYCLRRCI